MSSLVVRYEGVKKVLERLEEYSRLMSMISITECADYESKEHLTYQCEYCNDPILATYNASKCYASLEVI